MSKNAHPNSLKAKPGAPTFAYQAQVPALPVPDLEHSLRVLVETCKPLVTTEQLKKTKDAAEDFLKGQGPALQQQLLGLAASMPGVPRGLHPDGSAYPSCHWQEEIWERLAYFGCRDSIAVYSNVFATSVHDVSPSSRLPRAAYGARALAAMKVRLYNQEYEVEMMAGRVACHAQYLRYFGTCRVPGRDIDEITTFTQSRHIAVQCRGAFWTVEIIRANGELAKEGEILAALMTITEHSGVREEMAVLTSLPRTEWAETRQHLLGSDRTNAVSINAIESALFVLSLSDDAPSDPTQMQELLQRGSGTELWFDKSVTLVVFSNGTMGFNLEHGAADAVVPERLGVGIGEGIMALEALTTTPVPLAGGPPPKRLTWAIDEKVRVSIASAWKQYRSLVAGHKLATFEINGHGSQVIKTHRAAPDSLVQIAIQLAHFRDLGKLVATYETASMRLFYHGRTETIRSASLPALNFVRAFDDSSVSTEQKVSLLRKAIEHHTAYTWMAMCGNGIDRHLMALQVLAMMTTGKVPALFMDEGYRLASTWKVTSSQLPWDSYSFPGFGAPPGGYGVCYRIRPNQILATVAAQTGNHTNADRFAARVKEAILDILNALVSSQAKL
eukprot:NODE_430_length_2261_cov_33.764014_g396_i0.p1 GENE.NODE_430_length_2261_cov_33.764014_g396_i0~~NODE_430_length_2261_cov_33.764014_g396_i0.p1  ORF type:complete len:614 (-),score=111.84 NODE_430_length_2261_cov_33.764014_g396_i0:279-2120(-)